MFAVWPNCLDSNLYRASVPRGGGETPKRTIRVPDDLWEAVKRVAADRDETVAAVIIRALERYVHAHPLDED